MRPEVTFLTSSELQDFIGNELSDGEMEELQGFRDDLLDGFRDYREALEEFEDIYGEEWRSFDVRVWIFEGRKESISSPILVRRDDLDVTFFRAFTLLAKKFLRENPVDSRLLEKGYGRIDAVATVLVEEALSRVMEEKDHEELVEEARSGAENIKTWRKADDIKEDWSPGEEVLKEWIQEK